MNLTDKQIELIRTSHSKIVDQASKLGEAFYSDLFSRAPETRSLFREDLEGQGMRFMSAIHLIVDHLDDLEAMDQEIDKLAAGHAALPIKSEWYRDMQEALIDTFAVALGASFTNEMELAWRAAFGQVCDRMVAKARPTA